MADIEEIVDNFSVLDDWDDRYRYLIELGRELPPLTEAAHHDANKVQGCASQVWLDTQVRPNGAGGPVAHIRRRQRRASRPRADRDPVRRLFGQERARTFWRPMRVALFEKMGLREHLTPQRSNGFRSMVERIRSDARSALAVAAV